jgi:hypothetical protein
MCALSALNLSYRGQATLEEAIEHYDRALSAQTPTSSASDLLSDGVFLRHYLLFIYDICMTVDASNAGAAMWVDHLQHLVRMTQNRVAHFGKEPHPFLLWSICSYDTYACLMGNGNCDYFRTVLAQQILPSTGSALTASAPQHGNTTWPREAHTHPVILNLVRGVLVHTAKLAQTAQQFRREAADRTTVSPGRCASWQAQAFQLQTELSNFWMQAYPDFLEKDSPVAGQTLDLRIRFVFECVRELTQIRKKVQEANTINHTGFPPLPSSNNLRPNLHVPRARPDPQRQPSRLRSRHRHARLAHLHSHDVHHSKRRPRQTRSGLPRFHSRRSNEQPQRQSESDRPAEDARGTWDRAEHERRQETA